MFQKGEEGVTRRKAKKRTAPVRGSISQFLESCVAHDVKGPGVTAPAMYQAYAGWCRRIGGTPLHSESNFARIMVSLWPRDGKGREQRYIGARLRDAGFTETSAASEPTVADFCAEVKAACASIGVLCLSAQRASEFFGALGYEKTASDLSDWAAVGMREVERLRKSADRHALASDIPF